MKRIPKVSMNQKKKILIVEDEPSLRRGLTNELEKAGFTVLGVQDGEEGLSMALAEHPDLILLDIILPKMDGLSLLKKLRDDSWGKDAAVIMLTNLLDPTIISQAVIYGAPDYLVKIDWTIPDVISKVKERLGGGE